MLAYLFNGISDAEKRFYCGNGTRMGVFGQNFLIWNLKTKTHYFSGFFGAAKNNKNSQKFHHSFPTSEKKEVKVTDIV
jgi:hypothetical protein